MSKKKVGNSKQEIDFDGGLLNIKHYGCPSELQIRDKRSHSKLAEAIRESMEHILMDIDECEQDIEKVNRYLEMLKSNILKRFKNEKNKSK